MKKDKLLFLFALLLTTVGYDKDTISPNEEIEYKKNPKRLTAQLLGIFSVVSTLGLEPRTPTMSR